MKNKRLTIKIVRRNLIIKWFLYVLLASFAYVISTIKITSFPKPLMLIPIAVCICSKQTEMTSSLVGLVIGFMLDSASGRLFGFNAFILMICCMFVSLLFLYLLRQNIFNVLVLIIITTLIQTGLDFLFAYGVWGIEHVGDIFLKWFLPSMMFTILASVPIIAITRLIERKFGIIDDHYIEEKDENCVRE